MSKRTKFLLGIGVIAALVIGWQVTAFAVHDAGKFELDGNAVSGNAATPADDWDRVCHQVLNSDCSTSNNTNGATAVDWVSEQNNLNASIFTGGGSKDPINLDQWAYKDGSSPDKDNLLHSFAARYTAGGQELLYFGSDRYDNSGDAQQGFWFFQDPIGLGTNNVGGGKGFTGAHRAGDLLIVSDFSVGGTISTISVYTWDPTCTKTTGSTAGTCGDANLRIQATSTNANCASATANDNFCGIVSPLLPPNDTGTTPSPWPFLDKSGKTGFLGGELYEGGVNLTALGLGDRCFSSVMSETRSSTSTTAVLKDFVLGGFGNCGATVTTQQQGSESKSIGTGSVSVSDSATVSVTGVQTWSGTVQFALCGPVPTSTTKCAAADTTRVAIGSAKTVNNTSPTVQSDAATVTKVGKYCWSAHFHATNPATGVPDKDDDGTNECFTVTPVTPPLDTQAVASPVDFGQPVQDNATLSGTATQPGNPVINGPAGPAAGGTITFTLLKADCTTPATGTGNNPQTVDVNGNGTYGPVSFTPDEPGTYHWKAEYTPANGDPNNLGSTHNGSCNDTDETVVVNQQNSTVQTEQKWVPNDTATLNHGGPSGYSVKFTLLKNQTEQQCKDTNYQQGDTAVIYTEQRPVSGSAPFTASSNNTNAVTSVDAGGDEYRWKIEVPATGSFKAVTSCVETTAFTSLTNGGTVTSP